MSRPTDDFEHLGPPLPPIEELSLLLRGGGRPRSNKARKGDADFKLHFKTPDQKKAAAAKTPASGDFEKKHPRGRTGTSEGGKFVRKGASGAEVSAIQRAVGANTSKEGGKLSDKPGSFGFNTAASVRAYQRKNGLVVDGVVGRQTAAMILSGRRRAPGQIEDRQRRLLRKSKPRARGSRGRGGIVV